MMTMCAARGQRMKLVMDILKNENSKNCEQKICYAPQKKAENMQNSYSDRKSRLVLFTINDFFFKIFSKVIMVKKPFSFFRFIKIFRFFLKNGLKGS